MFVDEVLVDQLAKSGQAGGAFGSGEDACQRPDLMNRGDKLGVSDRDRCAARRTDRVEDEEVADAFRHAKPRSDRRGVLELVGETFARMERPHDRSTRLRLHAHHPRPLTVDPAHLLHLVKRLPHPDQSSAAAGRVHDHVGES